MDYSRMAQLELLNALNSIKSEADLIEFKDLIAQFFSRKAQKSLTPYGKMALSMKKSLSNGEKNI